MGRSPSNKEEYFAKVEFERKKNRNGKAAKVTTNRKRPT